MNIQLLEIAIWSKDLKKKKKVITFQLGKINIIHGASQTGKSAIIPIVDYCLCSSHNNIPVGIIRNKSSWFGIRLKVDKSYLVLARENRDNSGGKFYYEYSDDALLPDDPIINQPDIEILKAELNNILGIPFFKLSNDDNRPSFRDLVAFNFQPQNIIANPNCLLYKSDLSRYRNRLRNIFDFAIGAENAETMYMRQQSKKLEDELAILLKEQEKKQAFIFNETMKQQDLVLKAISYGLLKKEDVILNDYNSIIKNLKCLTAMSFNELTLSIQGNDLIIKKLIDLNNELEPLYIELRRLEKKKNSLEEYVNLGKQYIKNLNVKRDRLSLADFIKTFCIENAQDCSVLSDVDEICDNLHKIEEEIRNDVPTKNSLYEKELTKTNNKINEITNAINSKLREYKKISEINNEKKLLENFMIDIGRARNLIDLLTTDNDDLDSRIDSIKQEIDKHKVTINADKILYKIKSCMEKYIPSFAEFKSIHSFNPKDLTLIIRTEVDGNVYLNETGSGSNWVAYHLASSLGFQKYFIENSSFVFNFLILDQPSQVYFPSAIFNKDTQTYVFEEGGDIKNVREMFELMNRAINDNNHELQILVMDHAGANAWQGFENSYEVEYWTSENALIPNDW